MTADSEGQPRHTTGAAASVKALAITSLFLVACVPPRTERVPSARANVSTREFAGVYCNLSNRHRELQGNGHRNVSGSKTLWELLTGEEATADHVQLTPGDGGLSARLHDVTRTVETELDFNARADSLALPRRSRLIGHHYVFWGSAPERVTLWLDHQERLLVTRDVGGVTFLLIIPVMATREAGLLYEFERAPECGPISPKADRQD